MSSANEPDQARQSAFRRWAEVMGRERVLTSPETRREFGTATFATTQAVRGILQPISTPEVQACLRIANEFHVPVYPVSRGQNWGLGSTVPPLDGCVIMDLSRMNRIVDFSEHDAYLTVEPGVTFE